MLEKQSTEARRNTYRRKNSGIALLFSGILLTILAGAVVVISTVLQQTQRELGQLRSQMTQLSAEVRPAEGSTRDAEALQEWVATLRSEVADARVETTKAVTLAREEGRADRIALRKSLARVLHAHGAEAEEILAILGELSPSERARFQTELAAISPRPPGPGPDSTTGSDLTPLAPPEVDPTPSPVTPPDGPDTPEDPPPAIVINDDGTESNPDNGTSSDPDGDTPEEPAVTTYVIKRGDNLSKIAQSLGVSEEALRKANNIRNPNLIRVGATLQVPIE